MSVADQLRRLERDLMASREPASRRAGIAMMALTDLVETIDHDCACEGTMRIGNGPCRIHLAVQDVGSALYAEPGT